MWIVEVQLTTELPECICGTCCNAPANQSIKPKEATAFINFVIFRELIEAGKIILAKK
jgi:hypothetical protein